MRNLATNLSAFSVVAASAMLGAAAPAHAATVVLTFDQANSCVPGNDLNAPAGPCTFNAQNLSPTYGSTPELSITYKNFDADGNLSQSNLNWTDEGLGQGSAYATGTNGPPEDLEFIFTPISGFEVSLSSVETWVNNGVTPALATFTLFNDNQLVSTTPFAASAEPLGVPHTVTNFSDGYFSGPLRLHVSPTTSRTISFDNITLNSRAIAAVSGVPEPSTWAMMISGFGFAGAALRRRRRKTITPRLISPRIRHGVEMA